MLKHPRGPFLIPLFFSAAGFCAGAILATCFFPHAFLAYLLYCVSAVLFAYSVYAIVLIVKNIKRVAALKMRKHRFTNALAENYGFRTAVFSSVSVFLNVANSIFNGMLSIVYGSVWHAALSGYYFALALVRCGVLAGGAWAKRTACGDKETEMRRKLSVKRAAGVLLLLLELVIPAAVARLLVSSEYYDRLLLPALASAAYSFVKLALVIVNLVKARRHGDPVVSSIRGINFIDALMSILITQLMLVSYAGGKSGYVAVINICTGSAVCCVTAAIGIIMTAGAHRALVRRRRDGALRIADSEIKADKPAGADITSENEE